MIPQEPSPSAFTAVPDFDWRVVRGPYRIAPWHLAIGSYDSFAVNSESELGQGKTHPFRGMCEICREHPAVRRLYERLAVVPRISGEAHRTFFIRWLCGRCADERPVELLTPIDPDPGAYDPADIDADIEIEEVSA